MASSLALGGAENWTAHAETTPVAPVSEPVIETVTEPLDFERPDPAGSEAAPPQDQVISVGAQLCQDDVVDLRTVRAGGQAPKSLRFQVEIVDTPETRARGLMYRETMARDHGMLFIYEAPQRADFWMKNTLIPLDIIFADVNGRVVTVHEGAKPLDLTPIHGGMAIQYVLEVNAGVAKAYGISPGAVLRHPRFGAGVIWPCG